MSDIAVRICVWHGGPLEFWQTVVDGYTAAGPHGGGVFDFPEELERQVLGITDTVTGEPVTVEMAIDDWRLWDFLAGAVVPVDA
jgi:hypothetical protein